MTKHPSPMPGDDRLSPDDHQTPKSERTLVYPVVSRRAGGLSVGVNLNPGKECNWACIYCEVQGLVRGAPGPIDLNLLEEELDAVLGEALQGRWTATGQEPVDSIKDISIAGDGEPTLSPCFADAVELCAKLRQRHGLDKEASLVVITNGSQSHRKSVQLGFERLGEAGGEVWFKLDAGDRSRRAALNKVEITDERIILNLISTAALAPTHIQTMAVAPHTDPEGVGRLLAAALERGARPMGILLYGIRRPSCQPGGDQLQAVPGKELRAAAAILERTTGLTVQVYE